MYSCYSSENVRRSVANMIGHPKHAKKAIEAGTDILIAQGGEGVC